MMCNNKYFDENFAQRYIAKNACLQGFREICIRRHEFVEPHVYMCSEKGEQSPRCTCTALPQILTTEPVNIKFLSQISLAVRSNWLRYYTGQSKLHECHAALRTELSDLFIKDLPQGARRPTHQGAAKRSTS